MTELVSEGFFRGHDFDAEQEFKSPILRFAAELLHAHEEFARAEPGFDDIEVSWPNTTIPPRLYVSGRCAGQWHRSVEQIPRLILEIELSVRESLREPRSDADEHHEGIGSAIGRFAYVYLLANPRAGDGWKPAESEAIYSFDREWQRYDQLSSALMDGNLRLPPMTRAQSRWAP